MATCLRTPGPVRNYAILDLLTASDHNSGWRHGPDYDGLDPSRVIVPTTMELHLLHLRLITRQLRGRIPLLLRRTWTPNAITPRKQNLPTLLLVPSANMVCPPKFTRLPWKWNGSSETAVATLFLPENWPTENMTSVFSSYYESCLIRGMSSKASVQQQ